MDAFTLTLALLAACDGAVEAHDRATIAAQPHQRHCCTLRLFPTRVYRTYSYDAGAGCHKDLRYSPWERGATLYAGAMRQWGPWKPLED